MDSAEAVGEARRQQLGHLGPLLVGKTGAHPVGPGVFNINFLMGHVQIAAEDDRLFGIQLQQVGAESVLPCHPVVQPLEAVLAVGGVAVDEVKLRVFQRQHTALVVVLFNADAGGHAQRRGLAPAGCAGVALLLRRVCIFRVALGGEVGLPGLHLGLLHREHVRVQRGEACGKIVGQTGAQPVHVPADEFHVTSLSVFRPYIFLSRHRCGSGSRSRSRGRPSPPPWRSRRRWHPCPSAHR